MTLEEFLKRVDEDDDLYTLVRRFVLTLGSNYSIGEFKKALTAVKTAIPEFGTDIWWGVSDGRDWKSYKDPLDKVIKRNPNYAQRRFSHPANPARVHRPADGR